MKKKTLPLLVLGVIVFLLTLISSYLGFTRQGIITSVIIAVIGIVGLAFINKDKFRG